MEGGKEGGSEQYGERESVEYRESQGETENRRGVCRERGERERERGEEERGEGERRYEKGREEKGRERERRRGER